MRISQQFIAALAVLLHQRCNVDENSLSMIQQRLWQTVRLGTYRLRFNAREEIIGFCDYDCSEDGIVHVRKLLALSPGIITSLVSDLKHTLPWKRVFFYRAKYRKWKHHSRPRRIPHALVS